MVAAGATDFRLSRSLVLNRADEFLPGRQHGCRDVPDLRDAALGKFTAVRAHGVDRHRRSPRGLFSAARRTVVGAPVGDRRPSGGFGYGDFVRAAVVAGRTPNGVFGAKVMWGTLEEIVAKLAAVDPDRAATDVELLDRAFGRTRFVFLRREDTVAQAVSWLRAEQTNQWYVGHPEPFDREPNYDFDAIHQLVGDIRAHNSGWLDWFASVDVRPYSISYEDLILDPAVVTSGILAHLGLDIPDELAVTPRHQQQFDEVNTDWIPRYRAESDGTAERSSRTAGLRPDVAAAVADAAAAAGLPPGRAL